MNLAYGILIPTAEKGNDDATPGYEVRDRGAAATAGGTWSSEHSPGGVNGLFFRV